MTAFISWARPVPVITDPTLDEGLRGRLADPLWMLARQIGFGELAATDAGSPVSVTGSAVLSRLSRMRPGPDPGTGDPDPSKPIQLAAGPGTPLEALIEAEAEPIPFPASASADNAGTALPRPLASAQSGQHYLRMLHAAGINDTGYESALSAAFPVPATATTAAGWSPPVATDPVVRLYAGRVPDGQALYGNLTQDRADPTVAPPGHPAPAGGFGPVAPVAQAWVGWYEQTSSCPAGAAAAAAATWKPLATEYAADLAAPGPVSETVLRTGEHTAGPLDWSSFDLLASDVVTATGDVSLGAVTTDPAAGADEAVTWTAVPAPATYRGAPNPRWWTFEDGSMNFGDISAPQEGSVTAVVVEYALRYGTDHYLIPVPVPVGALARVNRLVVTTTFGERILIKPIAEIEPNGPFRVFELSGPDPDTTHARDPLLVMFPTVAEAVTGSVLERVGYARDELAETVWGVEQTVLGPLGTPVDRSGAPGVVAGPTVQQATAGAGLWDYLLHTAVAPSWYAFVLPDPLPADVTQQRLGPTRMRYATITDPGTGQPQPQPWGAILKPQAAATGGLLQEEVTRAGLTVSRAWRYARWVDGSTHAWVARTVQPGSGEVVSGLAFDLPVVDAQGGTH